MGRPQITVERWEGLECAAQLDVVLPMYKEIWTEPPYCEGPKEIAEFLDRFAQEVFLPRARLVVARCGDLPVGYAFGYPLPQDTGWWKAMDEETTSEFVAETGRRTLGIVELAVRADWRRQGVAARMHDRLQEGLGVERVTLAMRPDPEAAPAHATYAAWGYRQVGRWTPAEDGPVSHIMLLNLPTAAREVLR
ncbi:MULTISPECIES: GNAT family N-acetyltransferase [unclassified Streptomyces]|uniref:GNAT family N-acetyltransferase n=1 Tax=unclassified Streptomyces TaxID=2593676 RepID=UPI00236541BA|nr:MULTISPECIES: GNAT family N-acetyltransferase [unclassified Streptomyces]MDF3147277.1 GNAT family N-acetyltransferase [Streptomyces sp. T21Q-yed]WDF38127.1 GNAT family N-acetyltransferase [Streptomyces sp. T12]